MFNTNNRLKNQNCNYYKETEQLDDDMHNVNKNIAQMRKREMNPIPGHRTKKIVQHEFAGNQADEGIHIIDSQKVKFNGTKTVHLEYEVPVYICEGEICNQLLISFKHESDEDENEKIEEVDDHISANQELDEGTVDDESMQNDELFDEDLEIEADEYNASEEEQSIEEEIELDNESVEEKSIADEIDVDTESDEEQNFYEEVDSDNVSEVEASVEEETDVDKESEGEQIIEVETDSDETSITETENNKNNVVDIQINIKIIFVNDNNINDDEYENED